MEKVRAKFYVSKIENQTYGELVVMNAVYSSKNNKEDNQFSEATPSGQLTMTISNPTAKGFLQEGMSYYLDFTQAPDVY